MNISKIKIIDAPCGAGKTSWAIQEMNAHPEESYIYCTPFLDEIQKIRELCGEKRFPEPISDGWRITKLESFNKLVGSGTDIAVTHSTFLNSTVETMELIKDGEYTLILDEAIDAIEEFDEAPFIKNDPTQNGGERAVKYFLNKQSIEIGADKKITWIEDEVEEPEGYEVFSHLAKLGRLFYTQDKLLVCVFPPEMFSCFKEIYVMTYLFEGSPLKWYFDLFGIEYEIISVRKNDGGAYSLCKYDLERERREREKYKSLITICDIPRLNRGYKYTALSSTWYKNNAKDPEKMERICGDMRYFFESVAKAKAADIMWTCQNKYYDKVKGQGYTRTKQLSTEERKKSKKEREALRKKYSCFIPLNARATNEFKDRWALAYVYNMNMHPFIHRWLEACGVQVNNDLYSVSCLIQWLFRSRIRDNEPVILYLPSPRMRKLLTDWLDCKI